MSPGLPGIVLFVRGRAHTIRKHSDPKDTPVQQGPRNKALWAPSCQGERGRALCGRGALGRGQTVTVSPNISGQEVRGQSNPGLPFSL